MLDARCFIGEPGRDDLFDGGVSLCRHDRATGAIGCKERGFDEELAPDDCGEVRE